MNKKVYVSNNQGGLMLNESDIIYFAAAKRKVFLHYMCNGKEAVFEFRRAIYDLEQKLKDEKFLRIHRCYIVNAQRIIRIEKEWIFLDSAREIRLPLGRVYADRSLRDYMSRKEEVIVL